MDLFLIWGLNMWPYARAMNARTPSKLGCSGELRGHASVQCCLKLYSVWLVFISLFKLYLKVLMVNVLQVVKNHTKLQILMYSVSPLLSMNHAYVYLGACKVQYVPQFICPYLLGTSSKRTFYLPPTGTATRDGTVAKLNRHRFYEFCIAEKLNRSGTIRLFGCLFMLAVSIDDTPWERWNNIYNAASGKHKALLMIYHSLETTPVWDHIVKEGVLLLKVHNFHWIKYNCTTWCTHKVLTCLQYNVVSMASTPDMMVEQNLLTFLSRGGWGEWYPYLQGYGSLPIICLESI